MVVSTSSETVCVSRDASALNEKQTAVLKWVIEGCPDGVFATGYEHRVVGRALERRGLITITGNGPSWTATATKAGIDRWAVADRELTSSPQPPEATSMSLAPPASCRRWQRRRPGEASKSLHPESPERDGTSRRGRPTLTSF